MTKREHPKSQKIPAQRAPSFRDRLAKPALLLGLLIAALTLVVYWQITGFRFVNYDDYEYVVKNPRIQQGLTADNVRWAFTESYYANWHPLTWLSYMLDAEMFGIDARGFHLTNLALHTANALLVLYLMQTLTGCLWRSGLVAAMFAVHPLHVETVAWVSDRKDLLCTLFGLAAIVAYGRFARRGKWRCYAASLALFLLSLSAKQMLVTLPVVLLLLDFWPLKRLLPPNASRDVKDTTQPPSASRLRIAAEKIPYAVVAGLFCVVAVVAQRSEGTVKSIDQFPLAARAANAVTVYIIYVAKALWPVNLAVNYPHPGVDFSVAEVLVCAAVLLTVTVVALWQWRKHSYLLVGWAWYLVTFLPVIGLVQIGIMRMADRYTYFPSIGFYLAGAWGIEWLLSECLAGRMIPRQRVPVWGGILGSGIVLALAVLSARQAVVWRDSIALFTHALSVNGEAASAVTHYQMAHALHEVGRYDEAQKHYAHALELKPGYANAYHDLGVLSRDRGRLDEAIDYFVKSIECAPGMAKAHYNLALALQTKGDAKDLDRVVAHYQQAIEHGPGFAAAHANLGVALEAKGDVEEAYSHYTYAIYLDPLLPQPYFQLSAFLRKRGEIVAANKMRARGHVVMGRSLAKRNKHEEAAGHFREALRLLPDDAEAQQLLEALSRR